MGFQSKNNKNDLHNAMLKDERGVAQIAEATILLPFCLVMVIALFYASIFICQKANLQANVQNALIYYKNVDSDTYVEASDKMPYHGTYGGTISAVGSSFSTPAYEFPYRFFFMKFDGDKFKSFFRSVCGQMFFDDGSNVDLKVERENYVIYKTITATATQTVKPAISLKMVGASDSVTISVTGKVVVANGDDMVRNTDFVIDIVRHTALGKKATEMLDKAKGYYEKFKNKFGV